MIPTAEHLVALIQTHPPSLSSGFQCTDFNFFPFCVCPIHLSSLHLRTHFVFYILWSPINTLKWALFLYEKTFFACQKMRSRRKLAVTQLTTCRLLCSNLFRSSLLRFSHTKFSQNVCCWKRCINDENWVRERIQKRTYADRQIQL